LPTFDPLDPRVAAWWQQTVDALYAEIPDFAGFVVKADSEGRAGPASYGRTPAHAANMIARALKPRGGLLFYRSFVTTTTSTGAIPKMIVPRRPTIFFTRWTANSAKTL